MYPKLNSKSRYSQFIIRVISNYKVIIVLWLLAGVVVPYTKFFAGRHNNYLMFRSSFYHLINEQDLYVLYPDEYIDNFKYGPIFCVFMAPIAFLPQDLGILLYLLTSALFLYVAIRSLLPDQLWSHIFCLVCIFEFCNNQEHFQTNAFIAALIILSFVCITRGKEVLAAACIALGFFVKLYGVVGLIFLVFSKRKGKLLISFICWSVVFYLLPMFFSSFSFINDSYLSWFNAIVEKDQLNTTLGGFQDISVFGIIRRLTGNPQIPQLLILFLGCIVLLLPYLRFSAYGDRKYRFLSLACVLMFVVLFSSSSENPTYIILQCGVAAWFCVGSRLSIRPRIGLLLAVLIFSSITPTDFFPAALRDLFNEYSLRVLPCVTVWFVALCEMFRCRANGAGGHKYENMYINC